MAQDRLWREEGVLTIDLGAGVTVPAEVLDHREGEQDITQEELDEIERLDREATPGPWVHSPPGVDEPHVSTMIGHGIVQWIASPRSTPTHRWYDASLIALARTLLPRLARAYRAIKREMTELAGDLETAQVKAQYAESQAEKAYARGRREAIDEAARFLREHLCQAQAQWITTHETEISK